MTESICIHDWRVNPFLIIPELPPRVSLECLKCGKKTTAPFYYEPKKSRAAEVATWKRYLGDVDAT